MTRRELSAPDRIILAVRKSIYSGELKPGDPLLEMHLARQHGVSQTTVREALAKLEHAGLVRRMRNQGTFVTELSIEELSEHLKLRVALEGMAAVEAASRMSSGDFDELRTRLDRISKAVARNKYFEAAQADLEFHRYIWERSGNKTLGRILEQLAAPLFAYVSIRRSSRREDLGRVVRAHEPIVEALGSGAPEVVRNAVRLHIESSYRQFLNAGVAVLDISATRDETVPGTAGAASRSEVPDEPLVRR